MSCPQTPLWPVKASQQVQSTQGIPFEYLALIAKGVCISGPYKTETIGGAVFVRLSHPGHGTDDRLRYIQVFLWKRPIYLCWSLSLKERLQVYHITGGYRGVLREHALRDSIYVLSLGLATAHWELP